MENWKNRLKSHKVPLSAIWAGWEKLAKQRSHQKETQKHCEKKNQSLYTGVSNLIGSFSTKKLSKKLSNNVHLPWKHYHSLDSRYHKPYMDTHVSQ
jgi:hypothetical protein